MGASLRSAVKIENKKVFRAGTNYDSLSTKRRYAPPAQITNGEMCRRFYFLGGFWCVWGLFSVQEQQLKYTLSHTVVCVLQSKIQICCAFFKWSESSEDVGKQKLFCIP